MPIIDTIFIYTYNIQLRGVEEYVGMSYDEWLKNGGCYEKS